MGCSIWWSTSRRGSCRASGSRYTNHDLFFLTPKMVRSVRLQSSLDLGWRTMIALAVILLVIMGLIYFSAVRPGAMAEGVECVLYSRARTAHDSGRIDSRLAFVASAKQPYAPTCGTLRRSGQLRRP